jgi:hypothetical protein
VRKGLDTMKQKMDEMKKKKEEAEQRMLIEL